MRERCAALALAPSACILDWMQRWKPMVLGASLGLAGGVAWWFLWGCQRCDPGGEPFAKILFTTAVAAAAGHFLGRDHASSSAPR